jgi:hypothetical protein
VRCGLEFDFLDVVVAADGTPYASLGDFCTAEKLVGTAGSSDRASRCRGAAGGRCGIRPRQPRHGRLASARIYVNSRRVRTVRGRRLRAPIQLVRLARGRVRVMIVARTSTGRTVVHTRRYRTCARGAPSAEHCHRRPLYLVIEGE